MALAGIGLLLLGAVLILVHRAQQRKLAEIAGTETTTVASLRSLAEDFRQRGGGEFQYQAELKGTVECADPLASELAGQACVYHRIRVERQWEEDYWESDSRSGRRERRTRQGTDTMAANERHQPFVLRDATGTLTVDPQGADLETVQSVDRFEPGEPDGSTLSVGGFRVSIGPHLGSNRRTLGYRFQEWVTPVGANVYVLGTVRMEEGDLRMRKVAEPGRRFLICLRTEEEMVASLRTTLAVLRAGIVIALLAGAGLLVAALAGA